ncbi:MAG: serine protein kinase RIO [Candidatus Diapherotrites archaeon]|nr:serine protein kinase RIO [Candidatus Diapherotrites archaeon]
MVEERLEKLIKEENLRKHFVKVFDEDTILAVHKLAQRGYFNHLEFVISEGKEAVVFRAVDNKGNYFAVKIYKIETSNFKKMYDYLIYDPRFQGISNDKKSVIFAWTKKEYKNLEIAIKANLKVPLPIAYFENCLVMEFIGKDGVFAKTIKEDKPKDPKNAYKQIIKFIAKLYENKLVHSDLSEYNILNHNEDMVVIDMGQAVSTYHPLAKEFFQRDLNNIVKFFSKLGVNKSYEEALQEIKEEISF